MICTRSEILDVPVAVATVLQDRESSSYQRTLILRNLTALVLTMTLQESSDGGATWTDIDTPFTIGVAGGGADVVVVNIDSTNILRLRGQGGGDDRDLEAGMVSIHSDASGIWTAPTV